VKGWLPAGSTFEITTIGNWDNIDQPLHVEGNVRVPGIATTAGRRLLFPAEIFQAGQAKSFQTQKRVNAIWFNYPFEESDDLKIRVPAGYKPGSIPAAASLQPGPAVTYGLSVQAGNEEVEVKRHLMINAMYFSSSVYPAFRRFFGSVKTYDETQIVLETNATATSNK
jgi:hypothetical protein